jgi:septal ring factor EnvC (AmiA/AmiB activator)
MSDTDVERTIWPTYALRAWLGALVAHVRRSRHDLEARIDSTEKEAARLRRQHERAGSVIESLEDSIQRVDARLSQARDTDSARSRTPHGDHAHEGSEHRSESDADQGEHTGPGGDPDKKKARDPKTSGPRRAR